jgi:hypothetical protein
MLRYMCSALAAGSICKSTHKSQYLNRLYKLILSRQFSLQLQVKDQSFVCKQWSIQPVHRVDGCQNSCFTVYFQKGEQSLILACEGVNTRVNVPGHFGYETGGVPIDRAAPRLNIWVREGDIPDTNKQRPRRLRTSRTLRNHRRWKVSTAIRTGSVYLTQNCGRHRTHGF